MSKMLTEIVSAILVHFLGNRNVVVSADAATLILAEEEGTVVLAAELVDVGKAAGETLEVAVCD